ncbi:TIR domain-containing protein [Rhizobium ruizarguesonis]|uniref:TIR domain-containing protein n=1 Tax=Rhizobium ruizarguesonis TaxID=2081791 RepID=UPI0013DF3172|nr:TIR domain-containing protein [Rhizobium ruizarguesonis]NEI82131.1 cyclic nucleotide-binding domain-containing protein [Rhizobium ruizarguesonis]
MKERFEGQNRSALIASLKRQFDSGDPEVAEAIATGGELLEFKPGDVLIHQGGEDNDVFFLVSGNVSVVVKGQEVRTLRAGDHVGEMAAIEPSQLRSASVVATDTVVAVKMSGASFMSLADSFPPLVWRAVAQELSRRLFDRNRLMPTPNKKPRMFIMSSVEGLDVARAIQSGLQHDVLATVWPDGTFWAGGYPLEALETAVAESDFGVAVALFEDIVETPRGDRKAAIRDNVLFELGLFMGRLSRRRSILVYPKLKGLVLPSDLYGLTPASYALGDERDLEARMGPVCTEIRKIIRQMGVKIPGA